MNYTVITFAPVQGFIEKSRKLRDLYGGSFLLSYLADAICQAADKYPECSLISPALIDVKRGTPNQILIAGNFPKKEAEQVFNDPWQKVVNKCRVWIEQNLPQYNYTWRREWNLWINHTWEFFWAQEDSIDCAFKSLQQKKYQRDWTGINWQGESSSLSGSDAIVWYGMTDQTHPLYSSISQQNQQITEFYQQLSQKLSNAILDETERLSIPELVKRMITLYDIGKPLNLELPKKFVELNRYEEKSYTGWFQGDGDGMGTYLKNLSISSRKEFSQRMRQWGEELENYLNFGRIIYAGGDDFLGVLFRQKSEPKLTLQDCLYWFDKFHREIWPKHGYSQDITVSVGFVWAASGVPQRDILQQCREAEKSAKNQGKNRLAVRILFNSGNYLEWVCPWENLKDILDSYCDRSEGKNWTHFYNDIATLENRRAFTDDNHDIANAVFNLYFNQNIPIDTTSHQDKNNWVINLSKVANHLT